MSDETAVVEVEPGTDLVVLLKGPEDKWPVLVSQLNGFVQNFFRDQIEASQALLVDAKAVNLQKDSPVELYAHAANLRKQAVKDPKEIEAKLKPMKLRCDALKDVFMAVEKAVKANGEDAKRVLDPALDSWEKEQRRLEQIERDKAEKAARKEDEKVVAKAAEKLLDEGFVEEAEKLVETPRPTPTVAVPQFVPKIQGQSSRPSYSAELVSLKALVKAAAANDSFLPYLEANMSSINKLAAMLKEQFLLPGCKLITGTIRSSR